MMHWFSVILTAGRYDNVMNQTTNYIDGLIQMKDKRKQPQNPSIDQALLDQGSVQLKAEISTLENWLEDLKAADSSDPAVVEARKAYLDMLRSRREMLDALQQYSNK